ncbi:MAG TPA: MarR family transcriptional regulator [Candidatus Tumulicola sp.]|nr:MarR family transcriptional regulator [Candidatus Tumulicola sp.]
MDETTTAATAPADETTDDLLKLRSGIMHYCQSCSSGNFDNVNLMITLKRTLSELSNLFESTYGDLNLTPGRLNILMVLDAVDSNSLPLSELGDYLVVTRANITGLIDGLVRDGVVQRTDYPGDRRMVLAELTKKGKEFMAWFAPRHHGITKQIVSCFSTKEKRQLVELLDKLRAHVGTLSLPKFELPSA